MHQDFLTDPHCLRSAGSIHAHIPGTPTGCHQDTHAQSHISGISDPGPSLNLFHKTSLKRKNAPAARQPSGCLSPHAASLPITGEYQVRKIEETVSSLLRICPLIAEYQCAQRYSDQAAARPSDHEAPPQRAPSEQSPYPCRLHKPHHRNGRKAREACHQH